METTLMLMNLQGAMGAFDTLYHHEFTERLTWRRAAARELRIHGVRNFLYAYILLGLAWAEWRGMWVAALVLVLIAEIALTLLDFIIEDRTRDLPPSERVTHTLLAVNYGAILAFLAPTLLAWAQGASAVFPTSYGALSWTMTLFGLGVLLWGARDLTRAQALRRPIAASPSLASVLPGRQSILVAGGTGFIGTRLCECLAEAGHSVTVLTRDPRKARKFRAPITVIDNLRTLGRDTPFDAIVHLAGEPVAGGRWTEARRRKIRDSRIAIADEIVRFIRRARRKPSVFVCGSAVGYYGSDETREFTDESSASPSGDAGFAHESCAAVEAAARRAEEHGVRVCLLRTGFVLGAGGGALGQMMLPFELGLGGRIGSGRQWMSWIHLDDIVGLIIHAIAMATVEGPLNGTAPHPVRNAEFTRALGHALHRPAFLRVPAPLLRLALGQMAEEILLGGQKVLPKKAEETGYQFLYPRIEEALAAIMVSP
jgi:hypothetical protein